MAKRKPFHILISAVGNIVNRDTGEPVIGNVTDVVDNMGPVDEIYLVLTPESTENARAIRNKYPGKIHLLPDPDETSSSADYINYRDYMAILQRLYNLKLELDQKHDDLDINYHINITAGTKLMTAALSAASVTFNAKMYYADERAVTAAERIVCVAPQALYDPTKLKGKHRKKIEDVLGYLMDKREADMRFGGDGSATRAQIRDGLGNRYSGQVISYITNELIEQGMIEEPEYIKKNSPLVLTAAGINLLTYLCPKATESGSSNSGSSSGSMNAKL